VARVGFEEKSGCQGALKNGNILPPPGGGLLDVDTKKSIGELGKVYKKEGEHSVRLAKGTEVLILCCGPRVKREVREKRNDDAVGF